MSAMNAIRYSRFPRGSLKYLFCQNWSKRRVVNSYRGRMLLNACLMILNFLKSYLNQFMLIISFILQRNNLVMATSTSDTAFPQNLKGFGYGFNKEGKLRKLDKITGEPGEDGFEFRVSEDNDYNQKHYEALGDVITEHVYGLLEEEVGLVKLPVPASQEQPSTFIFASQGALTTQSPLLVLVHGSGVVRAGQWARSLIINHSLDAGTQIPYIRKAKEKGYGVLVLNTNDNVRRIKGKTHRVKASASPVEHLKYVWKNYIQGAKSNQVLMVVHSYGGYCIVELAKECFSSIKSKVVAIAMTDSVHRIAGQQVPPKVATFLAQVSRNWVSSNDDLDVEAYTPEGEIPRVSAGTGRHEMTSWSCMESVFAFLEESLNKRRSVDEL